MIVKKLKKFFSKNKTFQIPVFLNTWNNRVIAREGAYFTPELIKESAHMGKKFPLKKTLVKDTFVLQDFETLLKKDMKKYGFITENLKYLEDLKEYLGKVSLPEPVISELEWLKKNYPYNYHHIIAVTALTIRFARDFFIDEKLIIESAEAALLYDMGIGHISPNIINKSGLLSHQERLITNYHPIYSALLIAHYYQDENYPLLEPVLNHHENSDGTGFPRKIQNDSALSQIIKIADTFDALISARPFRKFVSPLEAFKICEQQIQVGKINLDILPILYSYYLFIDQYPEENL